MTTKEYLSQIWRMNKSIKNKLAELQQTKELYNGIPSNFRENERVNSTPDPDKLGSAFVKIESIEEEINEMVDRYVEERKVIVGQIEKMSDEFYYEVLFGKYILNKSLEEIAAEIPCSYRNVTRLHGNALISFEKNYGSTYLNKKIFYLS